MKIAIIGSGIAGLVAGYRLAGRHEITLFERLSRAGMDAHRTPVTVGDGSVIADVPSRMFNDLQWPQLSRLYAELGIESVPVDGSQSFSEPGENGLQTYLTLTHATQPLPRVSDLLSKSTRNILSAAARLMTAGREDLERGTAGDSANGSGITLGEYLHRNNLDDDFKNRFLYPTLSSTVCTCSYTALDEYPADVILTCLKNLTANAPLMRTRFGTGDVVDKLTAGFTRLQLGTSVQSVDHDPLGVDLMASDGAYRFDRVIFATQANTARKLLASPTGEESEILDAVRYETIEVVVHTDPQFMPASRKDWRTFNMISSTGHDRAMCTVWLNRFHDGWEIETPVFQTIMPVQTIQEQSVVSRIRLQRPVVTCSTAANLQRLRMLNQQRGRRILFCGSWADYGVPLLETGVTSARMVADARIVS